MGKRMAKSHKSQVDEIQLNNNFILTFRNFLLYYIEITACTKYFIRLGFL